MATVVATAVIAAQVAPCGFDQVIATSPTEARVAMGSLLRPVAGPVLVSGSALALVAWSTAPTAQSSTVLVGVAWFGAAMATPVGLMLLADLQRRRQHVARLAGQAAPLAAGVVLIGSAWLVHDLNATAALGMLGAAALLGLPARYVIWRRHGDPAGLLASSARESPVVERGRSTWVTARRFLALQLPAITFQRCDVLVLSLVATRREIGFYAFAASFAFAQTAAAEQLAKRDVADPDGRRQHRSLDAAIALTAGVVAFGAAVVAVALLPAYRPALPATALLIAGWSLYFPTYREEMLERRNGGGRLGGPYIALAALAGLVAALGTAFGATGAGLAFLVTTAGWRIALLLRASADRKRADKGHGYDAAPEQSVPR